MKELIIVKEILKYNKYSCVISDGNEMVYTSVERGVKPLLEYYHHQFSQSCDHSLYVADKVIGKGAAFILVLLSIKGLYTPVISQSALELLQKYGIEVQCDRIAPFIKNRTGEGRCPIESAVIDEEDPVMALDKIIMKVKELTK